MDSAERTTVPVRVGIADSDPATRRALRQAAARETDVTVVAEYSNAASLYADCGRQRLDVVLVDLGLPGLGQRGIDVDRQPGQLLPIYLGTDRACASDIFDARGLDYIVKPPEESRVRLALRRAVIELLRVRVLAQTEQLVELTRALSQQGSGRTAEATTSLDRLLVRSNGSTRVLRTADIDWIKATRNHVHLHVGREALLLRASIGNLAVALDPTRFARIHRSTIVNLDRVKEMQPWFRGAHVVVMRDGTQLRMSRRHRAALVARLGV